MVERLTAPAGKGRGRVIEPQHDARVVKGRETTARIQSAFLALVQAGNFRPSLAELGAASGLPLSTLRNAYPRLSILGAVVADAAPRLVVDSLGLPHVTKGGRLNKGETHALAYALLVGERFTRGEARK